MMIHEKGEGCFLVRFPSLARVLGGGLWFFDDGMVLHSEKVRGRHSYLLCGCGSTSQSLSNFAFGEGCASFCAT